VSAYRIGLIEAKFVELVQELGVVRSVFDHEPGQRGLPALPAVTLLFLGGEMRDEQTGITADVDWAWDVFVYVPFNDAKKAQEQLKSIVPELLRLVREKHSLDGACEWARLTDPLTRPEQGPDEKWLRKTLRLRARAEEV
jgi:hypothetical protein